LAAFLTSGFLASFLSSFLASFLSATTGAPVVAAATPADEANLETPPLIIYFIKYIFVHLQLSFLYRLQLRL